MKKNTFLSSLILLASVAFSQRANVWCFDNHAGLNFNTPSPTTILNGQTVGPDNSSSISNSSGSLLFYTDGVTVWNKNNVIMPNGSGLVGHTSAGQCALIIPIPCDTNKYVIFHVTEFSNPGYLNYSVVDMSLNSGLGDVIVGQKNISLGSGWTEKLCAYYNPNGNYYWLFSHKWSSDQFVAFKIDASSIATQSVTTSIGSIHNCGSYGGAHDAMGQLTISPDGSKIVNAFTCQDKFELFDLNINTGILSNSISIPGNGGNSWGTAFSPDSKKLYTDDIFGLSVFQYDLTSYNQTSIVASKVNLYTSSSSGYNFGYMELGPDNKLYIAKPGATNLTVINNPNNSGIASNFSLSGPSLSPNNSTHGLSRIAYNAPANSSNITISASNSYSGSIMCIGQAATVTASGANTFTWSTAASGSVIVVSPSVTTTYTVSGTSGGCHGTAAITVSVSTCDEIIKNEKKEHVKIYPTPFQDEINVQFENSEMENSSLKIINTIGQTFYSNSKPDVSTKINLSYLPSGLYIIQIQKANTTQVLKIIKN